MDGLGTPTNCPQFMSDQYPAELAKYHRVTSIVQFSGLSPFPDMPAERKQFYMDRGTQNHLAWQMVEEGTADGYEFDPAVLPYLPAHARFLKETGFRALPGGIEMRVKNDELRYKGTLDRLGTIQNRVVLIDYKTTKPTAGASLQTALYLLALPGYKFREVERYAVGFGKDSKYTMSPKYPDSDESDAYYWADKYLKEVSK